MQDNDPGNFPFLTGVVIRAFGAFGQGGWAYVENGESRTKIQLPQALFSVLAVLILKAKQAAHSESWLPSGFISIASLCQEIKCRTLTTPNPLLPDPEHAIRYVFRLRQRLGRLRCREYGRDWAKSVLEFVPMLGYRLSAPPENLYLRIFSEPQESGAEDGTLKPSDET